MTDVHTLKLSVANLEHVLDLLEEDQAHALLLTAVGGVSYKDAAQELGCPIGTVKSRVHRARDAITAQLTACNGNLPTGTAESLIRWIDEYLPVSDDKPGVKAALAQLVRIAQDDQAETLSSQKILRAFVFRPRIRRRELAEAA